MTSADAAVAGSRCFDGFDGAHDVEEEGQHTASGGSSAMVLDRVVDDVTLNDYEEPESLVPDGIFAAPAYPERHSLPPDSLISGIGDSIVVWASRAKSFVNLDLPFLTCGLERCPGEPTEVHAQRAIHLGTAACCPHPSNGGVEETNSLDRPASKNSLLPTTGR